MAEYTSCLICRRPGDIATTKTMAGAWQYAVACAIHGRIQQYWSTTLASASGKSACLPTVKVKRAAAVA